MIKAIIKATGLPVAFYNFDFIIFSTSLSSGKRSNSFLEKISSSPNLISKTPPEEGMIFTIFKEFLCSFNKFSARATALFK